MGTRLFIGNLSYNVNEQELREAFTGEGIEVRSVRVALDRDTGRPRGFAFVETMTDEGAKASIVRADVAEPDVREGVNFAIRSLRAQARAELRGLHHRGPAEEGRCQIQSRRYVSR